MPRQLPRSATSRAVRIRGTSCLLSSSISNLVIAAAEGQTLCLPFLIPALLRRVRHTDSRLLKSVCSGLCHTDHVFNHLPNYRFRLCPRACCGRASLVENSCTLTQTWIGGHN